MPLWLVIEPVRCAPPAAGGRDGRCPEDGGPLRGGRWRCRRGHRAAQRGRPERARTRRGGRRDGGRNPACPGGAGTAWKLRSAVPVRCRAAMTVCAVPSTARTCAVPAPCSRPAAGVLAARRFEPRTCSPTAWTAPAAAALLRPRRIAGLFLRRRKPVRIVRAPWSSSKFAVRSKEIYAEDGTEAARSPSADNLRAAGAAARPAASAPRPAVCHPPGALLRDLLVQSAPPAPAAATGPAA